MKWIFVICMVMVGQYSQAQSDKMDNLVQAFCDSLTQTGIAPEKMVYDDFADTMEGFLEANYTEWEQALNNYKEASGQNEYGFGEYFQHRLLLDCDAVRIFDTKTQADKYVGRYQPLRPMYLNARKFSELLEANAADNEIMELVGKSMDGQDFSEVKNRLDEIERSTTYSLNYVAGPQPTFRIRYDDYITGEPEYVIDVIFTDKSDSLIDKVAVREKEDLMVAWNQRMEYLRRINAGEIDFTPPEGD